MVIGASYSHTDILKLDSLSARFHSPSSPLLTVLEIPNAFKFKAPHSSLSPPSHRSEYVNSTSKIQLSSFFTP